MASVNSGERYLGLKHFLVQDPENPELLREAAEAALAANQAGEAFELFDRLGLVRALDIAESNLRAMAAMRSGRPDWAADEFERLRDALPTDPALSFNHAWALSLTGRHDEAAEALTDQAIADLPQAAMLQVQLLHQAGRFDDAALVARQHITTHPDYQPLLAAVSVLAMDLDDEVLALRCAHAGGDHPDATTTLGLLQLGDGRPDEAKALFQQALETQPQSPRALIGLGLAHLAGGDAATAGRLLDRGANIFGSHLGSWIASGWSHLLAGAADLARARFEHALALDPNFAETHGSLAVIDLIDGKTGEAERKCETALRLDRQCFSASLAKTLLASAEGDQERAEKILQLALHRSLDNRGRTLADAIARMAI